MNCPWPALCREFQLAVRFRRQGRTRHLLICIALLLLPPSTLGASTVDPETRGRLAEITASLDKYAQGIRFIAGRCRYEIEYEPKRARPGAARFRGTIETVDFKADLHYDRRSLEIWRSFYIREVSPTRYLIRSVKKFDGEKSYNLTFTHKAAPFVEFGPPVDVPHFLNLAGGDETTFAYLPQDWMGLRLRIGSSGLLSQLLQSPRVRVLRTERILGAECDRVSHSDGNVTIRAWLDPGFDFLPRRLEYVGIRDPGSQSADGEEVLFHSFEVNEFQQFPGQDDRLWWIPTRGRVSNFTGMKYEYALEECRLKDEFLIDTFQINLSALPPGVRVEDGSSKVVFSGGRRDLWEERQKQYDAHEERCREEKEKNSPSPSSVTTPVRATSVQQGSYLPLTIGLVSLAMIGGGVWLTMRRRRG